MAFDPIGAAGDLFTDATDAVADAIDDFADFLGLPDLGTEAKDAINGLINGPLRDFANSAVGKVVLRAMATGWYYQLGHVLGPQFAAVTFAAPGLLRGEKFDEAWTKEFIWRLTTTAAILGGMYADSKMAGTDWKTKSVPLDKLPPTDVINKRLTQIFDLANKLQKELPNIAGVDVLNFDYQYWATTLGVREDALLEALALARRDDRALSAFCTDVTNGRIVDCG